jgi:hypothetical protein
MLSRRDRRIPGSVYKPHCESVLLVQSQALGQTKIQNRIFFQYPKYCFRDNEVVKQNQDKIETSEGMKQGESFMQVVEWHKQLKPF